MNKILEPGEIWVWSKIGELRAKELNLETRTAGTPAYCGYALLGRYAPAIWVDKGYVVPLRIKESETCITK